MSERASERERESGSDGMCAQERQRVRAQTTSPSHGGAGPSPRAPSTIAARSRLPTLPGDAPARTLDPIRLLALPVKVLHLVGLRAARPRRFDGSAGGARGAGVSDTRLAVSAAGAARTCSSSSPMTRRHKCLGVTALELHYHPSKPSPSFIARRSRIPR